MIDIKWEQMDEISNEFVYRHSDLNAYIYRGRKETGEMWWFWEVSKPNCKMGGKAPVANHCFEVAEKVIKLIYNEGI